MNSLLEQIATLITTPPGNLSYHLVVTFAIGGALLALALHRPGSTQSRRAMMGLGGLFTLRLAVFLAAIFAWGGAVDGHTLAPVLDRAVNALSILLIAWLWAFPDAQRNVDFSFLLVGSLVLALTVLSLGLWSEHNADVFFNAFWMDGVWAGISLALAVGGAVLVALRKPEEQASGILLLGVLALGHGIHLLAPNGESDFAAAVRLSQMAAYPLLFAYVEQHLRRGGVRIFPDQAIVERPIHQERRRYTASPKTLDAFLALLAEAQGNALCRHLTQAIARLMVADICLLITPPASDGSLIVPCGFDLIREVVLEGFSLERNQVPLIATALERKRALRLPASSTADDLINLGQLLGLGHTGHLLLLPIPGPQDEVLASVLLLSPYARRSWTTTDQEFLEPLLRRIGQVIVWKRTLLRQQERLQALEEQSRPQETPSQSPPADLEDIYERVYALERENRELYENLARAEEEAGQEIERLQGELRMALEEVAHLQDTLNQMQAQLESAAGEAESSGGLSGEQRELLSALAQEIRQPMSSLVGYTDLLLNESAGILGALQRKFLERIKASIARMEALLDDLIRLSTGIPDGSTLKYTPVNMAEVIDQAIAQAQELLREKRIVLKVDLPEEMPQLIADRDALQQILFHLLNNASLVTPENGEIEIKLQQVTKDNTEHVLLQVTDSGGGIPQEDIPRVFSRLYRADNPLIPGVGDTGVGLSIAKTLTEAQHGRIWVENSSGKGATFSVLLPLNTLESEEAGI